MERTVRVVAELDLRARAGRVGAAMRPASEPVPARVEDDPDARLEEPVRVVLGLPERGRVAVDGEGHERVVLVLVALRVERADRRQLDRARLRTGAAASAGPGGSAPRRWSSWSSSPPPDELSRTIATSAATNATRASAASRRFTGSVSYTDCGSTICIGGYSRTRLALAAGALLVALAAGLAVWLVGRRLLLESSGPPATRSSSCAASSARSRRTTTTAPGRSSTPHSSEWRRHAYVHCEQLSPIPGQLDSIKLVGMTGERITVPGDSGPVDSKVATFRGDHLGARAQGERLGPDDGPRRRGRRQVALDPRPRGSRSTARTPARDSRRLPPAPERPRSRSAAPLTVQ